MGLESDSGETAWCATCGLENTPIFSCATLSSTLMICARTDSGECGDSGVRLRRLAPTLTRLLAEQKCAACGCRGCWAGAAWGVPASRRVLLGRCFVCPCALAGARVTGPCDSVVLSRLWEVLSTAEPRCCHVRMMSTFFCRILVWVKTVRAVSAGEGHCL